MWFSLRVEARILWFYVQTVVRCFILEASPMFMDWCTRRRRIWECRFSKSVDGSASRHPWAPRFLLPFGFSSLTNARLIEIFVNKKRWYNTRGCQNSLTTSKNQNFNNSATKGPIQIKSTPSWSQKTPLEIFHRSLLEILIRSQVIIGLFFQVVSELCQPLV